MFGRWQLGFVLGGLALGLAATPAAGLSCAYPDHGWGQLRVVELATGNTTAQVSFEGATSGYGCSIGNPHDLHEGWLAWTAGEAEGERDLHVWDLAANETARTTIDVDRPNAVSVDPPHVFVLEEGANATVHRFTVDPGGEGVDPAGTVTAVGASASLHSRLLVVLSSEANGTVSVRDLADERRLVDEAELPDVGQSPWRLLGSDGTWAVLASSFDARGDYFLKEDARAWLWRIGTEEVHEIPSPPEDGEERRLGLSVDIDGPVLYSEAWVWNQPWSPDALRAQAMPTGDASEVAWNGSLIDGIATDRGLAVTGSWLEEAPERPSREVRGWHELPQEPYGPRAEEQTAPGVGLALSILAFGLAAVRCPSKRA